jgi:hypothetical protein
MGGARLPVEELELQLLGALAEAARVEGAMLPGPQAPSKVWAPESAQRTLAALVRVPFFRRLTERVLIGNLRQVRLYLTDPDVRRAARRSLARQIGPDTRLIIGHSLGSVVAYEVLCIQPTDRQLDFVTLGSPLGLRTVIFDRLDPAPCHDRGAWPPCVRRWTNIADRHDLVAMVKELAPLFGGPTGNGLRAVIDLRVDNELRAHEVKPYLTARQTGYAVAAALTDGH